MLYVKEIKDDIVKIDTVGKVFSIKAEYTTIENVDPINLHVARLAKLLEGCSNGVLTVGYSNVRLADHVCVRTHGDELLFFPLVVSLRERISVIEWITSRYPAAVLRDDVNEGINRFTEVLEYGYDDLCAGAGFDLISSIISYSNRVNYHRDYFNQEELIGRQLGDTVYAMLNIIHRLNKTMELDMDYMTNGLANIVRILTSDTARNLDELNRNNSVRDEASLDNEFLNDLLALSTSALGVVHTIGYEADVYLRLYLHAKHGAPIQLDVNGLVDDPEFKLLNQ